MPDRTTVSELQLHGRRVAVRHAGSGPVVLLVHGLASDLRTWDPVVDDLARRHTVVVPDLPGHGRSDPPPGDYSLGATASWLRDVLDTLGHDRATVVGHSLGGGIAMQFAYQYPQRCARLVLVASGGLGPDVSLALRAASLPGSELLLSLIAHRHVVTAGATIARCLDAPGIRGTPGLAETARSYARLAAPADRRSFVHTVRAVVDHRGQRIDAHDRLHLLAGTPTLIVWGTDDHVIPVGHAHAAHRAVPGSQLELVAGAGHFPHTANPGRFTTTVTRFIAATAPRGHADERRWARLG